MLNNKKRKEERLHMIIDSNQEISENYYNLWLGGSIAYGIIMNVISVAFFEDFFLSINPWVFLILYFVSCITGTIIATKSQNPLFSFLGYNLIVLPIGGLLTICLREYKGIDIQSAMIVTGIIVAIMTFASIVKPSLFLGLGRTLFIGLSLGLIGQIIALLLGYGGNLFNWFFVILFSLYIAYDYAKAQEYPKTIDNAIDSAIDIYLDIINLFIRLLSIFSDD